MTTEKENKICIATRGSKLALWQANHVKAGLEKANPGLEVELLVLKTKGDKIPDVALAKVGGKGLFVKEIEEALLDRRAQIAVHSMKDVPTELPNELELVATDVREDVRDALFTREAAGLDDLPRGAKVGTSSLRRQAQLLHRRPDLEIVSIRGNVETRLRKLQDENPDAVVLAAAGAKRLGYADQVTEYLPVEVSLPATCQGSLGIQIRRDDDRTRKLIEIFVHQPTAVAVTAERAFLKTLEGGCQVPIAGLAIVEGGRVKMEGLVGSVDGKRIIRERIEGPEEEAEKLGIQLATVIREKGGGEILREVYEAEGQ